MPAKRRSRLHLGVSHAPVLRQLISWKRNALQLFGLEAAPKCAIAACAPNGQGAEIPKPNTPFPRRRQMEQSPKKQKGSPLKTAAWDSTLFSFKRRAIVSKLVVKSGAEKSWEFTRQFYLLGNTHMRDYIPKPTRPWGCSAAELILKRPHAIWRNRGSGQLVAIFRCFTNL